MANKWNVENSKVVKTVVNQLLTVAHEFLETGVNILYEQKRDKNAEFIISQMYTNKFIRQVAREANMPYIYVERGYGATILHIPDRPRLAVVLAPLYLLATRITSSWETTKHKVTLLRLSKDGMTFYFNGEEGVEIFNGWMHRVKNDPMFQIALRTK